MIIYRHKVEYNVVTAISQQVNVISFRLILVIVIDDVISCI